MTSGLAVSIILALFYVWEPGVDSDQMVARDVPAPDDLWPPEL